MNPHDITRTERSDPDSRLGRRKFLAVGAGLATTLVAGCSGGTSGEALGTFRLYISDQPVAIDEFDSLDVTIDGARIFRGEETSDDSETPTTEATAEETESEQDGFIEIEVDDETVDLTTVTGEKAIGVFDGDVPTGRYSSIHLSVSQVGGVVEGEDVDVELPSERLKIVKPFEVSEDEPLDFVFDITVVKKGQAGGYNLLPVVGESGVVDKDVKMEEVERGQAAEAETNETTTAAD